MRRGELALPAVVAGATSGIVVERWLRAPLPLAFDDIVWVFRDYSVRGSPMGTVVTEYAIVLHHRDGARVRLDPRTIHEPEELFIRLERRAVRPHLNELERRFAAGERLSFGPISLDHLTLHLGGVELPLSDLVKIEVSPEQMIFRPDARARRSYRLVTIPFPFILVRLLRAEGVQIEYFEGFEEIR